MSEELLAKVVSERNALRTKWEKVSEKLAEEKKARAADVERLSREAQDLSRREFEARVDAMTWKADLSRAIAQKNLALTKLTELEAEIARLKRLVP